MKHIETEQAIRSKYPDVKIVHITNQIYRVIIDGTVYGESVGRVNTWGNAYDNLSKLKMI